MDKKVIARTVALFVVLINQMLVLLGWNPLPFGQEQAYEGVTALLTFVMSVWAWWENNSFTGAAKQADEYMKELKGKKG